MPTHGCIRCVTCGGACPICGTCACRGRKPDLNAFFGKWPGEESNDQLVVALNTYEDEAAPWNSETFGQGSLGAGSERSGTGGTTVARPGQDDVEKQSEWGACTDRFHAQHWNVKASDGFGARCYSKG